MLLNTIDPVRDIDDFSKCQNLISITAHHEIFGWNKKRYKYKIYRKMIKIITISIYFLSSLLVALPFSYSIIANERVMYKITNFTIWQKLGISSYFIIMGLGICVICVDKVSKIKIAERLVVSNKR